MDRQSHAAYSDDLNAFVDGSLTVEERALLTSRLAEDPAMEQELVELQATARLLGHLPEFTPRRSFRLGDEYARTPVAPAQGKLLQFLPIVRTLSVAAALIFMVVAGSLYFDINGGADTDSSATFQEQGEILETTGETDSHAESSDEAEDADGEAATGDNESSMTSRGDAASAGDAPMQDLTEVQESGDDVAQSTTSSAIGSPVDPSDDEDRSSWFVSSAVFGGLALVLAALWYVLAKVGRQSSASRS